jgi:hypothetical protein
MFHGESIQEGDKLGKSRSPPVFWENRITEGISGNESYDRMPELLKIGCKNNDHRYTWEAQIGERTKKNAKRQQRHKAD